MGALFRSGHAQSNLPKLSDCHIPLKSTLPKWIMNVCRSLCIAMAILLCSIHPLCAQQATESSYRDRIWISGQMNWISQLHGEFPAKYSGTNSLVSHGENITSRVFTLFTGFQIAKNTELFFDMETAGGGGISTALGLAGFTNLDVVRNPTLGSTPYIARYMVRQIIPLSKEMIDATRGPFAISKKVPVRRIEIRAGKFGTADYFDANAIGTDSHLQFMNWTVDNNGGYDYAADTRGYSNGVLIEYWDHDWTLRFGEMLMPTVANGLKLDWNPTRARAENVELERRHKWLKDRNGAIRLLTYFNHANMGDYRQAIAQTTALSVPDVTGTRKQGRLKYGFGANLEQELTENLRVFGRWGWNEGRYESFAYTEVNQTVLGGGDFKGQPWHRKKDRVGAAIVSNAISGDHRRYLANGGLGFLLGDGGLRYGRENIIEIYYNFHIARGAFMAVDLQKIWNPGYNQDRGPVLVPSIRLHFEIDKQSWLGKTE